MYPKSWSAFVICCLFIFLVGNFYYPKWKQPATEAAISWDVSGYYFYLPATFIYQDLRNCSFADDILKKYQPTPELQQAFRYGPDGHYIMKYTMGQSVIFLPCFAIGHVFALILGFPRDGFSLPYQICLAWGMLLYAFLGLYVLRKWLLRYFSDISVALTLLLVVFATNYLNYSAIDGGMTHNSLFTLYAVLLLCTDNLWREGKLKFYFYTGLVAGLITLIRPTEIICMMIPLSWGIHNLKSLKERLYLVTSDKRFVYLLGCFILILIPQLAYWKWVGGKWFIYTYQNEGFDWLSPHVIKGLFSYKAGWLVYTPVMILSMAGMIVLFQNRNKLALSFFLFTGLFIYVCFAWHEWWYGASLGQRAMIQAYPVLCFPIAAFINWVGKKQIGMRWFITIFVCLCASYNVWLTHESHKGGLFQGGEMNRRYYWAILGHLDVPKNTMALLDNEENDLKTVGFDSVIFSKPEEELIDDRHQYSKELFFKVPANAKMLRAEATFITTQKEWDTWRMPQFIVRFYKNGEVFKTNFIRINRLMGDNETSRLHVDALIPDTFDKASILFWGAGSHKVLRIKDPEIKVLF